MRATGWGREGMTLAGAGGGGKQVRGWRAAGWTFRGLDIPSRLEHVSPPTYVLSHPITILVKLNISIPTRTCTSSAAFFAWAQG